MNDDQLDGQFRALPREVTPPDDLWPGIAARTTGARRRSQWVSVRGIAAAAALFVAGVLVGQTLPSPVALPASSDEAFLAAVHVQEAGTAYIEAVSSLERVAGTGEGSAPVIAQGREAARATIVAARAAVER